MVRSKTHAEAQGATVALTSVTMEVLSTIRPAGPTTGSRR